MDKREFQAEFKIFDDDAGPGRFEGLAAVFGNVDRQGEVILPGAFKNTLQTFLKRGFLANGHNWNEAIGTLDDARETEKGLWVAGEFHSTDAAQTARKVARERHQRGKEVAMSIGFQTVTDDVVEGKRLLKEIELFEVSLVTVPANPEAHLLGVKGNPPHPKYAWGYERPDYVTSGFVSIGNTPNTTTTVTTTGVTPSTITIWPAPDDEEDIEARRAEVRRIQIERLAAERAQAERRI